MVKRNAVKILFQFQTDLNIAKDPVPDFANPIPIASGKARFFTPL